MQLKEIMTSDFHAIPHNATIQEAAKMMRDHDIGLLPVMENGKMIGTVTDRDIAVRAVAPGGGQRSFQYGLHINQKHLGVIDNFQCRRRKSAV